MRIATEAHNATNGQPFVSVIIPVYNGGKQLDQCLEALTASSYQWFEIIVVDDNSSDDSAEISWKKGARVFQLTHQSGPAIARNHGALRAHGDILFFIDADVVVQRDSIARVAENFSNHPEISAVFGSYDNNPAELNFLSQYKNLYHHFVHQQASSNAVTFWAGCGAVRRGVFNAVGGFLQRYQKPSIEDIELGYRMRGMGHQILLDKDLQVKHLKRWETGSLLRSDILHRAVPWSQLVLESHCMINELNLTLAQRISAVLVGLSLVTFPFSFFRPELLYAILFFLTMVLILNRRLYRFFIARKGLKFAGMAFPLQLFYFFYSGTTFVICWALHTLGIERSSQPDSRMKTWFSTVTKNQMRQEAFDLSRSEWVVLSSFTLLALSVRLFMLKFAYVLTNPDGVYYALLGKSLVSGNFKEGLSTYWAPLYPLLVGGSSIIFRDLEFAGRFVSVLAGSLLVVPVYLLIRNSYGMWTASIAAFLIVINSNLVRHSTALLSESTYMLLFMTGILLGWLALSTGKSRTFFLAGLLFGACYLVKPEAICYVGLMVLLTFSSKLFFDDLRVKKVTLNALILLLGFLLLSSPYILYLRQKTGSWTISKKLSIHLPSDDSIWAPQWLSLTEDGQITLADTLWAGTQLENDHSGVEKEHSDKSQATSIPTLDFLKILDRSRKMLYREYKMFPNVIPLPFFILAGIGLFRTRWSKERAKKEIYLLLFFISTLIGYALTAVSTRQLMVLVPILIGWSSIGVVEFEAWLIASARPLRDLKIRKLLRCLIMACLMLPLLSLISYQITIGKRNQPIELKEIGSWIKNHSASTPPSIMSSSPETAFYAQGKHLYLPAEEYKTVINYAKQKKVDYIVIYERNIQKNSSLKFLLDEQNQNPELQVVYKYDEIPEHKALVFKLTDSLGFAKQTGEMERIVYSRKSKY